jgi:glutamyl-tRNA reductase
MFFIDIAVPRDVDPACNKIEGLFVYDIDDLQQVAAAHIAERRNIAADAETLLAEELEKFHKRLRTVNVAPAIVALQRQAEELRQAELKRIQVRLASMTPEQLAAVETLTRGLMNKFLHPPMQALKQAARENDAVRMEALCETWSLPGTNSPAGSEELTEPAARPKPAVPPQPNQNSPDAPAPEKQPSVAGRR